MTEKTTSPRTISVDELHTRFKSLGMGELILDVRGHDEFAAGHIKGATCIPHTEVTQHLDTLKPYQTVYVHCKRGGRAMQATTVLTQAGLKNIVCVTPGGMDDWESKNYETVTGKSTGSTGASAEACQTKRPK